MLASLERVRNVWYGMHLRAFQADQNTPLFADVHQMMQSIAPSEKPLFLAHTMIAVHIHRGLRKKMLGKNLFTGSMQILYMVYLENID